MKRLKKYKKRGEGSVSVTITHPEALKAIDIIQEVESPKLMVYTNTKAVEFALCKYYEEMAK